MGSRSLPPGAPALSRAAANLLVGQSAILGLIGWGHYGHDREVLSLFLLAVAVVLVYLVAVTVRRESVTDAATLLLAQVFGATLLGVQAYDFRRAGVLHAHPAVGGVQAWLAVVVAATALGTARHIGALYVAYGRRTSARLYRTAGQTGPWERLWLTYTGDRLADRPASAAAALQAREPAADLKNRLLQWAADAHTVLDLQCDSEAALHLYALTPQAELAAELGALLGARAILLATESGDQPFDEACSRP